MSLKEAKQAADDHESGSFPASECEETAPAGAERLKVVTLAPGQGSDPDIQQTDTAGLSAREDPYLGCTVDGRYRIEAVLGEGGMGVVYRCTHKIIGKKVAMKVLRADLARDNEATERFLNEAKAASSIGNPHIIDISDFGQFPDGSTYFVMEYLEGSPLSSLIAGAKPMPAERILNIAEQLAEGLSAAHQRHIVHRDLKPDNVFLVRRGQNKDFVKILDFGIAKVSTAEGKLTRAGAVFGTPHYMSPEQAAGTPVDHRGDVYALGVILYELTSGTVPFDADNFMGILTQHIYKTPVPISALVPQIPDVPPGLEAIILKCLAKSPEQRYQSMEELLGDLERLKAGAMPEAAHEMSQRADGFNAPHDYFKAVNATTAGTLASASWRSRWPLLLGLLALALIAAVVVGAASDAEDELPASEMRMASEPVAQREPLGEGKPKVTPAAQEKLVVKRQVVLAVEPLDAHVFRDGEDLGESPVLVEIKEGESAALRIQREGFETQEIVLDGGEGRHSIKLVPQKKAKPPVRRAPAQRQANPPSQQRGPPKPKPSIGGSEIINPWG